MTDIQNIVPTANEDLVFDSIKIGLASQDTIRKW